MHVVARALSSCAVGALAVMGTSIGASAASEERGHWMLNESGNPDVALDASAYDNRGTNHNVTGDGSAYAFNGVNSRVVVTDDASLDPGAVNFSFGVTLSMTAPPAQGQTYDALRKGLASTSGGNYKIEIKHANGRAVARCVVKDTLRVSAAIQSQATISGDLADGDTHTITCHKTSTGVTVQVDNLAARTKTVTKLGSVSNTSDLALGAKAEAAASTGFDWYEGLMHDAWVAVG